MLRVGKDTSIVASGSHGKLEPVAVAIVATARYRVLKYTDQELRLVSICFQ